jgi:hypothetical protein
LVFTAMAWQCIPRVPSSARGADSLPPDVADPLRPAACSACTAPVSGGREPSGWQGPLRAGVALFLVGFLAIWLVKPIGNPCPDLGSLPQGSTASSSPSFSPPGSRTCTYTAAAGIKATKKYMPWLDWIVLLLLAAAAAGAVRVLSPAGKRAREERAGRPAGERGPRAEPTPRAEPAPRAERPPRAAPPPRAERPPNPARQPRASSPREPSPDRDSAERERARREREARRGH